MKIESVKAVSLFGVVRIFAIATDSMSLGGTMDSDLVHSAGMGAGLEKCVACIAL